MRVPAASLALPNTARRAVALLATVAALSAVRAAPPPVQDTIAQRVAACTACHGKEGRAAPDGYHPRIAGKPAGYLYHQLLNFRDGRRHYGPMVYLVDPLGDDYLREIAAYFAGLDLPHAPPAPPTADAATLERGRRLVAEGDPARRVPACTACHGAALTGVQPAIPGLLGLPRDYLSAQLGAWRSGQRRAMAPDCMAEVAKRLAPGDASAAAAWLATQPVPGPAAERLPQKPPLDCGGVAP